MSFWTDIARSAEPPRAAAALHVQLPGRDLFLLCEVAEASDAGSQLIGPAVGSFVAVASSAIATSASRILDQAMEAANRAVADAKRANPSTADLLVSVAAAIRDAEGLHFASVGAAVLHLRTGSGTRRLNEPESEARHLVNEGITAGPAPMPGEAATRPTHGLGLPPSIFRVRQSGTLREPDDYLLVLSGGRAGSRLGTAHIDTLSPGGGDARTAARLLRQTGLPPEAGTAILSAHRTIDIVMPAGAGGPPVRIDREPLNLPWKAILGGAALLAAIFGAIYLFGLGDTNDAPRRGAVPSPTNLLPAKLPGEAPPPSPGRAPRADTGIHPLDLTLPPPLADATEDGGEADDDSTDVEEGDGAAGDGGRADGAEGLSEAEERAERERRAAAEERRRERREKRRLERERREREAAEARRDARESPEESAATPEPAVSSADAIQVIDFSDDSADVKEAEEERPEKRPFPSVKLNLPAEEGGTTAAPADRPDVVSPPAAEEPADDAQSSPDGSA